MQPFSWSVAEMLEGKISDHEKIERRYSLNNEDFDFQDLHELFWVLEDQGLLREGATYYAADFALVQPDCFEEVDEFLDMRQTEQLTKSNPNFAYFKCADEKAKTALRLAIAEWIHEFVFVEQHWCLVGKSEKLAITLSDIP